MAGAVRTLVFSGIAMACQGEGAWLAELTGRNAVVEEERAEARGQWTPAEPGHRYRAGDAVRTAAGASATLRLVTGEAVLLSESTVLRFGRRPREVEVELGLAEIAAGEEGVRVTTSFGAAVIEAKSRARIGKRDDRWDVDVLFGEAVLDDAKAEDTRLTAGRRVEVAFGGAILEVPRPDAPASQPATPADGGATPEGAVMGRAAGTIERQAPGEAAFTPLPGGAAPLAPGTRLKLAAGAELSIDQGSATLTLRGPGEAVIAPKPDVLATVTAGLASFEVGDERAVEVPGALLQKGKHAAHGEVGVGGGESRLHVASGELRVRGRGRLGRLGGGQTASLDRDGRLTVWRHDLERADLLVPAGQSPVIHDPVPPTAVGIHVEGACAGGATLAIGRAVYEGRGAVKVLLPKGSHRYQVRCLQGGVPAEKPAAAGTVRVLRDAGTRPLPVRPQRAVVEADGRFWSLVYQTLLPEITFRWPSAKGDGRASLHLVDSGSKQARVVPAEGAAATLASGALGEGSYQWWFESSAGKTSARTELRIMYDSSAQSASIRRPGVGEPWTANLAVAGEVDAGWKVTVGARELELDRHHRFTAEVPAPDDGVLAIRLAHRHKGVQIYLRRNPSRPR